VSLPCRWVRKGGKIGESERWKGVGEWQGTRLIAYNHVKLLLWQPFYNAKKKRQLNAIFRAKKSERGCLGSAKHFSQEEFFKSSWHQVSANKHSSAYIAACLVNIACSLVKSFGIRNSFANWQDRSWQTSKQIIKRCSQRIPADLDSDTEILVLPAEMSIAY